MKRLRTHLYLFYSSESRSPASSISANLISPTDYETCLSLKQPHSSTLFEAADTHSNIPTPRADTTHITPYAAPCPAQTLPPLSSQPPPLQLRHPHQPRLQKDLTNSTMSPTSKKMAATSPSGNTGSKWSSNSENSGHSSMAQIRLPTPPRPTMQIG